MEWTDLINELGRVRTLILEDGRRIRGELRVLHILDLVTHTLYVYPEKKNMEIISIDDIKGKSLESDD